MLLFLRVSCGGSLFNDSFRRSHKVNVFKLTVIELSTCLSGFLKILSHYTMFLFLDYPPFLLPPSMLCPKPYTPFSFLSYDHPPWEVIYNAIGVTIIRLHTISPCPLWLARLLRAPFLFAQKHIIHPSSQNMQSI